MNLIPYAILAALAAQSAIIKQSATTAQLPPVNEPELASLVRRFLEADDPAERRAARRAILATSNLTHTDLEQALASLDLWPDQPTRELSFSLPLRPTADASGPGLQTRVRLPVAYSPRRVWPLLIILHGQDGKADDAIHQAAAVLGNQRDEFIIAAPQDIDGPGFSGSADEECRPRQLLVALRKRFHVDSDRVFIAGYSLGGHRAWIAAIEHADCFAAAMPLAGTLILPGGDDLFPDVLQNLRHLSLVCVWGANDFGIQDGKPVPGTGIAGINRLVFDQAAALGLNNLVGVCLSDRGHEGAYPPPDARRTWLQARRSHWPRRVRQTFRLAEVSAAYWVRATGLQGKPLPAAGVSAKIPVEPGEDAAAAVTRYYRRGVGIIEAQVQGQAITLTTQKCTYVELLLHPDLIDLSQPITVTRNGQKVYDAVVPLSLGVTLDELSREWDFARTARARLRVPAGGKAKPARDEL